MARSRIQPKMEHKTKLDICHGHKNFFANRRNIRQNAFFFIRKIVSFRGKYVVFDRNVVHFA